ncbi:MAG: DUF6273 domain-containing protein [Clostridia bacterium]|nr:DUF6273 domain-containing protein [Clostridia bacterium]
MAQTINIPRESTMQEIAKALNLIAVSQASASQEITSWAVIQQIVKQGMGQAVFPVGTQLKCSHSDYGEIVWDVAAHDYDKDPKGRNSHSMTLYTHNTIGSTQFDAAEALYCCDEGLSAGTYNFTIPESYEGAGTYQFTLANDLPEGGVICLTWSSGGALITTASVQTYTSLKDTEKIEEANVSAGSDGISLGMADGSETCLNDIQRAHYSCSNWKESNIRQYLNSRGEAGNIFTPQNKFDRPSNTLLTKAGFMSGFSEDFINAVGECEHTTVNNLNSKETYKTADRFYLPSVTEIFGANEAGTAEGSQFGYYVNSTDTEKIKYDGSGISPSGIWLRTPYTGSAASARIIDAKGTMAVYGTRFTARLAVACVIY